MADQLTWETRSLVAHLRGNRAAIPWLLPTIIVLFFISGICGLVYQVLWLRLLALVFGVTVFAASTVLAAFMAGLAIGSFAAGRLVDRVRQPLLWFGLVEIGVGVSALATQPALQVIEQLYVRVQPALPGALEAVTLLRFALSFVVLMVPTTLMGASLPIIVKSSLLRAEGLGERVSLLYATNTAGALLGTLLAGFVLVGGIGLSASFKLAASLNLLAGTTAVVSALLLARWSGEAVSESKHAVPSRETISTLEPVISHGTRRLVLVIFAGSGFTSLALEVIWFRVLVLFHETTTYAFTVMLATVLAGIAAGSYLVAPFMRRRLDWLVVLAALELAIGVTALLSLWALTRTPDVLAGLQWLGRLLPPGILSVSAMSFLALFPATLLMGMAFPIGLRLWVGGGADPERTGERVGLFYSLNVAGAILGSLIAGFLLLPWLGSQMSLVIVAGTSLLSGLVLLAVHPAARLRLVLGAGGIVAFAAAGVSQPDPFVAAVLFRNRGEQLLWREEGVQGSVSVNRRPNGDLALYLESHPHANDGPGNLYDHRLIGHLPMMLHPRPRDVLVIGLGGGTTAGAMSQHPGTRLDVVELSPSMIRGAEWFRHVNYDVLRQPNVNLRVDDGRNHLLLTSKRYDVIAADIIPAYQAGAGNLFSAEYFRQARAALNDNGLMIQWSGARSEAQRKLVLRTFLSVFPEATVWGPDLLIGTKRPLHIRDSDLRQKWKEPAVQEAMASLGIKDADALRALQKTDSQTLAAYVGAGPILTDDQPMVEYFLSLSAGS